MEQVLQKLKLKQREDLKNKPGSTMSLLAPSVSCTSTSIGAPEISPDSKTPSSPLSLSGEQRFQCQDCDFETSSLRKLGRHRSVNHSGTKYKCTECDFVTGYQSNFYRHRKQIHNTAGGGTQLKTLSNAAKTNLVPKMAETPSPDLASSTSGSKSVDLETFQKTLQTALLASTTSMPFWAGMPGTLFPQHQMNPFMFAAAQAAQLSALVQAQQMPGVFPQGLSSCQPDWLKTLMEMQKGNIVGSVKTEGEKSKGEKSDACNDCPKQSAQANSAQAPSSGPTENKPPPNRSVAKNYARHYLCPHGCKYETTDAGAYLSHLKEVHEEKFDIFHCDKCNYASKCAAKLRRHQNLIHAQERSQSVPVKEVKSDSPKPRAKTSTPPVPTTTTSGELLRCEKCKYVTMDVARFRKHVRCHEVTRPSKCHLCDFTTVYYWNLDRHLKSHEFQGRFTCYRCSFSQNTRQSMSFHFQHHHVINKVDVDTQTDEIPDFEPNVSVLFEPFIFEKHAVRVSWDYETTEPDSKEIEKFIKTEIDTSSGTASSSPAVTTTNGKRHHPTLDELAAKSCKNVTEKEGGILGSEEGAVGSRAHQRFLLESEVIENLSDSSDLEVTTEDIKQKTCSVCGYQGKWASEMIRHKRVHTNERPFKCKYCSRTSKWKADLIRHIAKVHGVRVLSKYSRSQLLEDVEQTKEPKFKEIMSKVVDRTKQEEKVDKKTVKPEKASSLQTKKEPSTIPSEMSVICPEELPTFPAGKTFEELFLLSSHMSGATLAAGGGLNNALVTPLKGDNDLDSFLSSPSSKSLASSGSPSAFSPSGLLEKYLAVETNTLTGENMLHCRVCPYETKDLHTFRAHTQKHENRKPYQCSGCGYRSNWSSDVHKHIRLKKSGHENAYVVKLESPNGSNKEDIIGFGDSFNHQIKGVNNSCSKKWSCALCGIFEDSRSCVITHLNQCHNLPPYSCNFCNFSSLYRKTCLYHSQTVHQGEEGHDTINENLTSHMSGGTGDTPIKRPPSEQSEDGKELGHEDLGMEKAVESPPPSVPLKKRKIVMEAFSDVWPCTKCPFSGKSADDLKAHEHGHSLPKAPMCYKCAFCPWYARKEVQVLEHMKLHTDNPEGYMEAVKRNLITSLSPEIPEGAFDSRSESPHSTQSETVSVKGDGPGRPCSVPIVPEWSSQRGQEQLATCQSIPKPQDDSKNVSLAFGDFQEVFSEFGAILDAANGEQNAAAASSEVWSLGTEEGNLNFNVAIPPAPQKTDTKKVAVQSLVNNDVVLNGTCAMLKNTAEIQKVSVDINGESKKMWQCRYCNHMSKRRANVRLHERKHLKQVLRDAKIAQDVLSRQGVQKNSMDIGETSCNKRLTAGTSGKKEKKRLVSTLPKVKNFECVKCPAKFTDRTQLNRHERFHGIKSKFFCHVCDYSVPFPINLTKHYGAHHKLKIVVSPDGSLGQVGQSGKKFSSEALTGKHSVLSEQSIAHTE